MKPPDYQAMTRSVSELNAALSHMPHQPVLVAFSGGLDSTVLLHALAVRPDAKARGLRAIHIQHALHPDAELWTQHCQHSCDKLGFELVIARVNVARDSGRGLEAAAREARYVAFAESLRAGEILALAHHQDDQAETVLLRLLRASGSAGLSSMQTQRVFAQGMLWRPLLRVPRSTLLDYAKSNDLRWIEDPSNNDDSLDRNFLRHRLLPTLQQRWPNAAAALARSAELLAEDAELLRAEASKRLRLAVGPDAATLSVTALMNSDRPWRSHMLRLWITELDLPSLPGNALDVIEAQLLFSRPDAQPEYLWAGNRILRWRDFLHVEVNRPAFPPDWQCQWNGAETLQLPTGDRLAFVGNTAAPDSATLTATVFNVRGRYGGERMCLPGRNHSHALKHLLQDLAIPPWLRERLPLVFAEDGELLAAGDLAISARLAASMQDNNHRLVWTRSTV